MSPAKAACFGKTIKSHATLQKAYSLRDLINFVALKVVYKALSSQKGRQTGSPDCWHYWKKWFCKNTTESQNIPPLFPINLNSCLLKSWMDSFISQCSFSSQINSFIKCAVWLWKSSRCILHERRNENLTPKATKGGMWANSWLMVWTYGQLG